MKQLWLASLCFGAFAAGCAEEITPPPPPPPSITAVFNPQASPVPQIPLPNDLVKTGGDGVHLNVPDLPTDSPAQRDFNHYLNTLDGFPPATPGSFMLSGPVDPASLTIGTPTMNGAVVIFNATGMQPLGPGDYTLTPSPDGMTVVINPTNRWTSGARFIVLVFGGSDPAGLKGADGKIVLASPAFFFLRSPTPLIGICGFGTTPACACPAEVVAKGDPNDPTCHSVITGLPDAQARQLEGPRQQLQQIIQPVLPFAGTENGMPRSFSNIVLAWSFTITTSPMAVFDPTHGDIPFPNDILIDQTTKLVNLPINPSDPQAAIKMGLNTLDGFSNTAPETLGVDSVPGPTGAIDPATVVPMKTAIMLGVTATNGPEYTAAPVFVAGGTTFAGQIAITPTSALESDQVRYAAIVTSQVKDAAGRNLVAPPVMVLVRGKNPLVDANGHSTVNVLSDSEAQQLEVLRQAEAMLFDVLESVFMLPRTAIAAAWTFTTQSEVRPLLALDQFPTTSMIPTDVTITHTADAAEIAAKASTLVFPSAHLGTVVFGTLQTTHTASPTTGTIPFNRTTTGPDAVFSVQGPGIPEPVEFVLALPNTSGPWPVAIVQHGLTTWRGAMTPVIDSFAAAGWATILIDLPFHGSRSVCTEDSQCNSATAGACNKMTGVCAGGLALATPSASDPFACALAPLSDNPNDCRPLASGAAFINPGNLFGTRDNLRQYTVDAAQLLRVLQATGATSLSGQIAPLAYDQSHFGFLGTSLGGIAGTTFLSVAPQPIDAVLNVTGGHLVDIIATGSFSSVLTPLLQALNVTPDTLPFFQLLNTAQWIVDPADPFALGAHLVRMPVTSYLTGTQNAPKHVIVQEAGMDTTILPQFQAALSGEILGPAGLDQAGHAQGITVGGMQVSTFFPDAVHVSLFVPLPSAAVTQSEQAQAVGWISSSGATLSSP